MDGIAGFSKQFKCCAPDSLSIACLSLPLGTSVLPFWVRLLPCRLTKYQAHMVQLRNQSRKRTFLSRLLSTTIARRLSSSRNAGLSRITERSTEFLLLVSQFLPVLNTTHLPLQTASEKPLIKVTHELNFSKSRGQFIYTLHIIQIDCLPCPRKSPQALLQLKILLLTSLRNWKQSVETCLLFLTVTFPT